MASIARLQGVKADLDLYRLPAFGIGLNYPGGGSHRTGPGVQLKRPTPLRMSLAIGFRHQLIDIHVKQLRFAIAKQMHRFGIAPHDKAILVDLQFGIR